MYGIHGDVIVVKIDSIPTNAKRKEKTNRGYILAEGETTGHAHTITDDCELYEKDGQLFIRNETPIEIKHEEHKTVTLPKGDWEVRIAQEYDHFKEEAKRVVD